MDNKMNPSTDNDSSRDSTNHPSHSSGGSDLPFSTLSSSTETQRVKGIESTKDKSDPNLPLRPISDFLKRLPSAPHGPRPIASLRPPISINELIPSVLVRYEGQVIDIAQLFKTQLGVVFGVPGAFSPVCTEMHVQGFKDRLSEFRSRGINLIVCIAVNDPFVIKAWAQSMGLNGEIVFLSDSTGALSKKLGLLQDFGSTGMGLRCRRCAMLISESRLRWIGYEEDAFAPTVIKQIDQLIKQTSMSSDVNDGNAFVEDSSQSSGRQIVEIIPEEEDEKNGDEPTRVEEEKQQGTRSAEGQSAGENQSDGCSSKDPKQLEQREDSETAETLRNDVNSFFDSVPVDHQATEEMSTIGKDAEATDVVTAEDRSNRTADEQEPLVHVSVIPDIVACSSPDVIAQLEEAIKGSPRDEDDDGTTVKYEIKRSQCNLLCESVDGSDSDTDCATSDSDDGEDAREDLDEDGFDDFSHKYFIDHHHCYGRVLHDVGSQNGDDEMDIKFGYLTPDQCRFIRRKATPSSTNSSSAVNGSSDTVLWDFYIEPRSQSAGYILVDNIKFYAREIHFHSPAVHLLRGSDEARPVEMHIVHSPELHDGEVLRRAVVLALTFVWEPDYDSDHSSKLVKNIINTVLGKTFRSDGRPNIVEFTDAAIDLQRFIAENTMAAFYRYTTDSLTCPSILESRKKTMEEIDCKKRCSVVEEKDDDNEEETSVENTVNDTSVPGDSSTLEENEVPDFVQASLETQPLTESGSSTIDTLQISSLTSQPSNIETTWIVARDGIPLSWESFQSLRLVLGHSSLQDPSTFSGSVNRILLQHKQHAMKASASHHSPKSLAPSSPDNQNDSSPVGKFLRPFPSMFLFNNGGSPLKRASTLAASRKDPNRRNANLLSSPTAGAPKMTVNSPVTLVVSSMLR